MGRTTEVRTGEEVQASSEGETRGIGRTRPAGKAKEKATEGKVNMKGKEEDLARGFQQSVREEKEERDRMALNMGAGGSHPQAMSDPGEKRRRKVSNSAMRKRKRF